VGPPALSQGLSGYRDFQLGSDLATIVKQTGSTPSQAQVIHSRPVLIQDLDWRPQPLGPSLKEESAQEVVFSFFAGALSRIQVNYDRQETEGLTADDMIEAISASYGVAVKSSVPPKKTEDPLDKEQLLARWEDPEHRFELIRFAYGPTYRLVGVLKNLEAPVRVANLEAKRLDDQEAPQRDVARFAVEQDAAKERLAKTRLTNKAKFRP
jgi:hypothetical protein